ncbi:hypothetical protein FCV25MIE_33839 [Fagus crenata]
MGQLKQTMDAMAVQMHNGLASEDGSSSKCCSLSSTVGLDRVLSCGGGGDIGLRSPAVSAELNLVKLEGNESWPIIVGVKSITGERLPGESRILKLDDKSGSGFGGGDGGGGGGGGGGFEFEAGQGLLLSGETMVGGPSFRVGYPGEYSVVVAVAEDEIVVSRYFYGV